MGVVRDKSLRETKRLLRVLVVENDASSRDLLARVLRLHGCEADTVIGADEGFKLLHKIRYDLLITDLHMEPTDGAELLEKVSRLEPAAQPRATVVLSGYLQDYYDRLRTVQMELELFQKPLHLPSLVGVLERLRRE